MKSKFVILLLIPLILFLQGCVLSTNTKAEQVGLDFAFLADAPPTQLSSDSEFQVAFKIENFGEATSAKMCLSDTVADAFGGISQECKEFSIKSSSGQGKDLSPSTEFVYFPESSGFYTYKNLQNQNVNIIAKLDYFYRTKASSEICVKDPTVQTAVLCPTQETISPDVKAPIVITKVEKHIFRINEGQVRLTLDIHLKNQGDGIPRLVGFFGSEGDNKVLVEKISFATLPLKCDLENNVIELQKDTEKVIKCSGIIFVDEVIKHPLELSFAYDYRVTKFINVQIV